MPLMHSILISLTFSERLLQKVMLSLQFDNEVAAIQVLLVFLLIRKTKKDK